MRSSAPGSQRIDRAGWLSGVERIPSPHFDSRPSGVAIDLLVVHAISLPPGEFGGPGIIDLFTGCIDPGAHPYYRTLAGLRASAHFLIRRDGGLIQFVACTDRAWHAGISNWRGRERCNDFSIGVELEGSDDLPFEDPQYATLVRLTRRLRRRFPLADIAGHSDIAPGRKSDPGPHFDWARYRSAL